MFYLHCTKKLLDRIKPEISPPGQSDTSLGNWYATALFWKPQVAMLVSERTLVPVLMPLAPAATLARRFPAQLALILKEHGIAAGILNEYLRQAEFWLIEITPQPHQRLRRRHSGKIFDSIGEAIQQLKVMTAIENCRTARAGRSLPGLRRLGALADCLQLLPQQALSQVPRRRRAHLAGRT